MPVSSPVPSAQIPPNQRVSFRNGLLAINASKATLAEILYEIHLRTGADIPIPSGAEQESVAIQVGPGRPKDVLAALLNGSRFNFILQGSPNDPDGIGTVLLTPRSNAPESPSQAYTPPSDSVPPQTPPVDQTQQAVVPDGAGDQEHPIGPPVMNDEDDPEGPPPPSAVQPDGQLAPPTAPPNPPMQPDQNTPPDPDNQQ
jgi:hypothetical protein